MNKQETIMDKAGKIILVTGATGNQGGAVARQLLAQGWPLRALVRDPSKPAAQALAQSGIELAQGDLDDRESLDRALAGVYGVFSVQNFWQSGFEGEIRQGKALADAAKAAGVQHFVYSSVDGAERNSGIAHFESKYQIEQHIQALDLPATILRPVFFMDNFATMMRPSEQDGALTIAMPLPPDTRLQMIAVDDIGAFAALAFEQPQQFLGTELAIAGDELTLPQTAEVWSKTIGKPVQFVALPMEQVRGANPEGAAMFQWFIDHGYQARINELRAIHPELLSFEQWLRKTQAA
jgi:uncharacterized protein YbjT (DUF2867 family)